MKWIKASDRVPANNNMVHINYRTDKTKFMLTGYYEPIQQKWFRQSRDILEWAPNLEWLDESEPSFSIEDMEDSYFEGKNGDRSFENFMKQEHSTDITK